MTISVDLTAPVSPYMLNDNLLIHEYRCKAIYVMPIENTLANQTIHFWSSCSEKSYFHEIAALINTVRHGL